jgi:hypothetical protein
MLILLVYLAANLDQHYFDATSMRRHQLPDPWFQDLQLLESSRYPPKISELLYLVQDSAAYHRYHL